MRYWRFNVYCGVICVGRCDAAAPSSAYIAAEQRLGRVAGAIASEAVSHLLLTMLGLASSRKAARSFSLARNQGS